VEASKQGLGVRILLDFDLGVDGTLRVSQAAETVGDSGGTVEYFPGLRTMSDLSNFADWGQVADADITLDNQNVTFKGQQRTLLEVHNTFDLSNRVVTVRFWMVGTDISSALTIAVLYVRRPIRYTELELELRCVGIQNRISQVLGDVAEEADLPNILQADAGKIFPIVFGTVPRVRGLNAKTAARTVVEGAVDDNDTTLTVADTSLFPSSGTVLVGEEKITYSGTTATTFTGLTRGASSTVAAPHFTGDEVVEVTSEVYVFAGHRSLAVTAVRDTNGNPVAGGAVALADTSLISGKALTTVTFTEPPMMSVVEGGTSVELIDLELGAGSSGSIFNPELAFALEAGFEESNFARFIRGSPTNLLRGRIPAAAAIEDLGEIVQIRMFVTLYGIGRVNPDMVARVTGEADLGVVSKGDLIDTQAFNALVNGQANISGAPTGVFTNIGHTHRNQITAVGTATNPDDSVDDNNGWITAVFSNALVPGTLTTVLRPTFKASVLTTSGVGAGAGGSGVGGNAVAIYVRGSGITQETLQVKWDLVGSVGDTSAAVRSFRFIYAHGGAAETTGVTVGVYVNNALVYSRQISAAGTRTSFQGAQVVVPGMTINDLHNNNTRIELTCSGSLGDVHFAHVAYLLLEIDQGINPSEDPNKPAGGNLTATGPLSAALAGQLKTWGVTTDFFTIPSSQLSDWADLPGAQFEVDVNLLPTNTELFVRKIGVEVEYRKRRKVKPAFLLADLQGVPDTGGAGGHGQASGHYTGTPNALIENPVDVFRYVLQELLGVAASRWDSTFNDAQRGTYNSDPHLVAGALMEPMEARRFIQRFLMEFRARFFPELELLRFKRVDIVEAAASFELDRTNIIIPESQAKGPVLVEDLALDDANLINDVVILYDRDFSRPPRNDGKTLPNNDEFKKVTRDRQTTSITSHQERRRQFYANFLTGLSSSIAGNLSNLWAVKYSDSRKKATVEATFQTLAVALDDVLTLNWPTLGFTSAQKWRVTKETWIVGDPLAGKAPRKRYELQLLKTAEEAP